MIPIVMLALLPLDLAAGAPPVSASRDGLRVEAVVDGRRVDARLTNVGMRPLSVMVGYSCGGPEPFSAIVDGGAPRSFQTANVTCAGNVMLIEKLPPGAQRIVASTTVILDAAPHRLSVRYQNRAAAWNKDQWHGTIESATTLVGAATLTVELRATVGPGGTVELEAIHAYRGPTQLRFMTAWAGACAGPLDQLIADDQVHPFVELPACDGPVAAVVEAIQPGGRFVTHGVAKLAPGVHTLRARYQVAASYLSIANAKGNIGDWSGEIESPPVTVRVP